VRQKVGARSARPWIVGPEEVHGDNRSPCRDLAGPEGPHRIVDDSQHRIRASRFLVEAELRHELVEIASAHVALEPIDSHKIRSVLCCGADAPSHNGRSLGQPVKHTRMSVEPSQIRSGGKAASDHVQTLGQTLPCPRPLNRRKI
jgi:hypothetical protein